MGAAASCGKDNDDLINIFKVHNYISTKNVERVFRAVDRRDYIFETHRELAYQDMSCKVGNIHLSAPCVYSRVMEGLSLQPGQSFLNIGSGTGYLSTLAGLILGDSGTNHGIEMHEDCLIYAQEHLEKFKRHSLDVDVFEFCEPVFQLGNFINVVPNRQYDRVYCGAACPETYEKFVKQFVKIGGILVMPYKDHLLRAERTGEKTWFSHTMLPVAFAPLMPPQEDNDRCHLIQLPLWKPRSLQELCRSAIRNHLRRMVWAENDDLETKRPIKFRPMGRMPERSRFDRVLPCRSTRNRIRRREVVRTATTLQLVMNSEMQSILAEDPGGFYGNDLLSESNDDSDEESEPEQRNRLVYAGSMDESTEDCGDAKESRNATEQGTGNDDEEGRENGRHSGQSSSTKMKNAVSNASSSDDERATVESMSDDDDDDDDDEEENIGPENDPNFVLVRNFFSRIASMVEIDDSESSYVSSSSGLSSSENDDNDDDDHREEENGTSQRVACSNEISEKTQSNVSGEAEQGQSSINSSSNSRNERFRNEEIATKIRVLSTPEDKSPDDKSTRKHSKIEDEKVRTIDSDTSNTSSEDEGKEPETNNDRTNYRRDYRAGQKRRSERKFSGPNNDSLRVKKTHKSEINSSSEKSTSSSVTMSTDSSFDTVRSDSDCDLQSAARKAKAAQIFSHTIRKDLFSAYMKKKILLLPLPPPLRVYVNYDREL